MSGTLSIRVVDPQCADALSLLHAAALEARALYPDRIPADAPMPTNGPAVAGGVYLIAYDGDLPLGMGALRPFKAAASAAIEPGVAEVRRMFVAAAGRRRGVGRAVLAALEQHAQALGYRVLRLETGNRQQPAIALYERRASCRSWRGPSTPTTRPACASRSGLAEPRATRGASARYALAIFDFDGTLADSWPWFAATINEVAAAHGFRQVDAAERERLRGLPTREILQALQVPMWKLPRIATDLRQRAEREAARIALFDGVPQLLASLTARCVRIAIVSSNAEATVRRVLGPAQAATIDRFDCGASLFGKAARFRRVLRELGCAPAQAIVVGDELRDLAAARNAGLACALVSWGYAAPAALADAGAELLCHSVAQLKAHLVGPGV